MFCLENELTKKMQPISKHRRVNARGSYRSGMATLLPLLLLLQFGCGHGERKIADEERGTPTTVPFEQQLFREARDVFQSWTESFGPSSKLVDNYNLLSWKSRSILKSQGVKTGSDFAAWFESRRSTGKIPFAYSFSRFDLLDIDVTDSTRAIITATFLVDVHQAQVESVGSFYLKREKGRWVVPFAESGDFIASWWQKEKNFARVLQEKGFSSLYSSRMGIELDYPTTWDAAEQPDIAIPSMSGKHPGIELSYLNPSTLERQALIRIISRPAQADSISRDSTAGFKIISEENRSPSPEYRHPGKITRLLDAQGKREIIVFYAVEDSGSAFSQYQSTFNSIIRSLTPTTSTDDSNTAP